MMHKNAAVLTMVGALILSACEGSDVNDWSNLPASVTGDLPGIIKPEESRSQAAKERAASERVPLVTSVECGPFNIDVRANPSVSGDTDMEAATGNSGEPFEGFYLIIKEPSGFSGRVRFRDLYYPMGNSDISFNDGGKWMNVNHQGTPLYGHESNDRYQDKYLGHDLTSSQYPFVEGRYITWQPWDQFY
ncbi:MAG: hypothetical protein ACK5NN_09430 [Sphingomonadaceae bacterium]